MHPDLRALDTGRRALRRFGFAVGGVLLALGVVVAWRTGAPWGVAPATLLGIGALLVVFGAAAPAALRLPYLGWMALALALGFVMTRVLLSVVFIAIVTPIGLVMRALGRDPMNRRPDPSLDTYWIPREDPDDPRETMTRYW